MKKFLAVMAIIALFWAGGSWIGAQIEVTTSTVITIASRAVDDTGTYVTPDSVRIVVYREGVEAFDAWFVAADGECDELNSQLVFFDAFGDIDGGAGTGIYQVSANFKESDDEYWVNTWYRLVDTTMYTYHSLNYFKTRNLPTDPADDSDIDGQLADIQTEVDALDGASLFDASTDSVMHTTSIPVFVTGTPDVNVASVTADAIEAGDFKTGAIDADAIATGAVDYAAIAENAIDASKIAANAIGASEIATNAIGASEIAAGAITASEAPLLGSIADTVNAILDTTQAHAPHGDDWGQGAGELAAITDTVNAILDTLQNQDDWVAGSADFDSTNNAIADANKANFKATGFATSGDGDSIIAAITDANKANFKATGFATSAQGDSVTQAIADANKANFKADTASIARSTWDDDVIAQASRTVTASCAGAGLRTINIYVQNSTDSTGLQSYEVSVQDSSSGTDQGRISTDSDGLATFSLDDDTYTISFSAAGWSITSPVYLTVTADDDTTYYATQYSPTPPSATYCVVYTHTYKLTGAYSGCRLEARIPVEYGVVTSSTFLTVPYVVADTSETDGKVELPLVRSTNLTSSAGLTPVKVWLQLFDPDGNVVADTLMEIPDQASKKIW